MNRSRDKPASKPSGADAAKRRLEAIAASIGAVLAVGTLGVIVWDGLSSGEAGARIVVTVETVEPYQAGYAMRVIARNVGDQTAAGVTVTGELKRGEDVVETGEIVFDYVAGRSQRRGGMFFTNDPASFDLDLGATGYADP